MDREIPKEIRQKERNKKIIRYSSMEWQVLLSLVYLYLY